MKTKRLWSTIVVSFICILLASCFVLQTSAETISQTFPLQSVSVVDAVFDTNEEEQPADLSYVQNVTVTDENIFLDNSFSSGSLFSSSGLTPAPTSNYMYPCVFHDSNYVYYYDQDGTFKTISRFDGFNPCLGLDHIVTSIGGYMIRLYNYIDDDYHDYTVGDSSSIYNLYLVEYSNYIFVFLCAYPYLGSNDSLLCYVFDLDYNLLNSFRLYYLLDGYIRPSYFLYDNFVYCYLGNGFLRFDLKTFDFVVSTDVKSSDTFYSCIGFANGKVYIFPYDTSSYYVLEMYEDFTDWTSDNFLTFNYPVSFSYNERYCSSAVFLSGYMYVPGSGTSLKLSSSRLFYYDPLDYQVPPNIEVDKYINFSYEGTSDGTQNGDGFIGLDLNFGVPASYFVSNEVTSVRFQGFAYSCSSSADQFVEDNVPLPYNVKMTGENLNVLTTYYPKLVGQVGDLYLYNYNVIFYVDASRVDSFDISLNTYIPAQTETHWFSIPCSTLDVSRYEGGSSGGGGSGSDLSQIEADLVIIQDQMSGMLTKFDDVSEGISQVENRLDEIQDVLTSLPDDFNSKEEEWSSIIESGEEEESIAMSYVDEYMSFPSLDASIEADFSNMGVLLESFDNGSASDLFSFIRYLWSVHPLGLSFASVVVVIATGLVVIRMS